MSEPRTESEQITEEVTSWPGVETGRDVIGLLRLNYDRAVERHGMPSEASA